MVTKIVLFNVYFVVTKRTETKFRVKSTQNFFARVCMCENVYIFCDDRY